ncbi:ATP-grasp domain-containing protein [Streptomyces odontomachi]|uniref:ATP-grasp domain-containing protein n=1 Tax=Streptomyces odontomachi TaxID=2944940 RepID=UPI00210D4D3E|nr:ATP-grasp domain-containing protein [Streptomyces sp. ODS25]
MSHVLIIEPVSSGTLLISAAHAAGHQVSVVSAGQGDRCLSDAFRDLVDTVITVDSNDEDKVLDAVVRAHERQPFDAILPGFEYYVPLVARLAARLGLPGLTEAAALRLRYKNLMREALDRAGVRVPRFRAVDVSRAPDDLAADVDAATAHVGLPCVVKPVDLAGSVLVRKAATVAEVRDAVARIAECGIADLDRGPRPLALIEEYVQGPEYSLEGYLTADGPSIAGVTRKRLGPEPHFVETGHLVTAAGTGGPDADLVAYVTEAVRVLGLDTGVFHAEVRRGPHGPVLMEVGARLPGDQICTLLQLAIGLDLPAAFVTCMLGRPPRPLAPAGDGSHLADGTRAAGIRFLVRPGLTRFTEVQGLDKARDITGYVNSALVYGPGQDIPEAADFNGRLGWFIFTAPDAPALEAALDEADERMRFL